MGNETRVERRGRRGARRARVGRGLLLALGIGLLVLACPDTVAHAKRGPSLRVAVDLSPPGWDPHVDLDPISQRHWEQVYESLTQFGAGIAAHGDVARADQHGRH